MRVKKLSWKDAAWWKKLILLLICVVLVSGFVEVIQQQRVRAQIKSTGHSCGIESIPFDEMQIEGLMEKDQVLFTTEGNGKIVISFDGRYVDKLQYNYLSDTDFKVNIGIEKQNVYGEFVMENIIDASRSNLNLSVVNIKGIVRSITLEIPADVRILDIGINNEANINKYHMIYIACFMLMFLCIMVFGKTLSEKIEYGFLLCSLTLGVLFVLVQPTQFMSWDEHIHFTKTFDMFKGQEIERNAAEYYQNLYPETMDQVPFASKEEKAMQIAYLNQSADEVVTISENEGFAITKLGYLPMAVVVSVTKMLNIPFYYCMLLGKLTNLILYSMLLFFTIKVLPVCKRTVMILGLMPTPLVLATAYSYDVTVMGFLFLGTALLYREYYEADKKIKWYNIGLIALCFVLGACPKAIYIPLILSLLFLPKTKFVNERERMVVFFIVAIACLGLLLSFIIPATGSVDYSDSRGGNTNVGLQMQLIFSHPIAYAEILCKNIIGTLHTHVLGSDNLAHMAYAGIHKLSALVTLICGFVFFTEPRIHITENAKKNIQIYRIISGLMTLGVVVLIWTALYLGFTEVGKTEIAGVSGRYYLPLMLPLCLICYTDKIKVQWKKVNYDRILYAAVLIIWHVVLYNKYLIPYCS